jgi:hypothetical protein
VQREDLPDLSPEKPLIWRKDEFDPYSTFTKLFPKPGKKKEEPEMEECFYIPLDPYLAGRPYMYVKRPKQSF